MGEKTQDRSLPEKKIPRGPGRNVVAGQGRADDLHWGSGMRLCSQGA